MSAAAAAAVPSPHIVSYQVSNRVPNSKEIRAYIKRSLTPYVEAAKAAEARRGTKKPDVGTVFRVKTRPGVGVIYSRAGYLPIEIPVSDYDMRLAESGGRLYNSDGRPYYASIQEWCAHIGASEEDVYAEK